MSIEARMQLFTEGQITRPIMGAKRSCLHCQHFRATRKKAGLQVGVCGLVAKMHRRMKPHPFLGGQALECSKFEERPEGPQA